jgi:membrane-bound metal-dependent hydrolase YbcI (DUF457 family)
MPTPVAHSLAGLAISVAVRGPKPLDRNLVLLAIASSCLADFDFAISFITGVNYHHYFTHSLGFTVLFAAAAYACARIAGRARPAFDAAVLGVSYLSHILLDMLSEDTAAPYGLELLWPFSDRFFISPVLLFDDIWRGTLAKLLSLHNWMAVAREVVLVGTPVALVLLWSSRARTKESS